MPLPPSFRAAQRGVLVPWPPSPLTLMHLLRVYVFSPSRLRRVRSTALCVVEVVRGLV